MLIYIDCMVYSAEPFTKIAEIAACKTQISNQALSPSWVNPT